jgi:hypothetical protein
MSLHVWQFLATNQPIRPSFNQVSPHVCWQNSHVTWVFTPISVQSFQKPFFRSMVNPPSSCLFRCKSHTWSRSLGASWSSGPFNFTALRKLNHPVAWWNGRTLYHIAKCSGTSYTWNMYKNQNFSHPGRKPLDSTVWLPKIGARDPAFEDQWLEIHTPQQSNNKALW